MEFRILGSLEVHEAGGRLALGGPQQRAFLAVLLLHRNQVVSTDRVIDALWGGEAPKSRTHTLQVYASRLRKLFAGDGEPRLQTRAPGYLLRVETDELDRDRFERLARAGRDALAAARYAEAAPVLREALALHRGPALADVAYEPFAAAEIARLEELHGAVLEDRVAAELALGEHARLVGELQGLVSRS